MPLHPAVRCRHFAGGGGLGPAAEDGQPRDTAPAQHRGPHRLRRARGLVARRQANRVHVEELRGRLRDRPSLQADPAPHRPLPAPRVPARALPAQRRLLPDRCAHVHRHPHDAVPRPGDVGAESRRPHAAHRARSQDLGGRGHLAPRGEDRLVQYARPVPRSHPGGRVGDLHGGRRVEGRRARARQQEGGPACPRSRVHARGPGLPEGRHRAHLHLLPVTVRGRVRDRPRHRAR